MLSETDRKIAKDFKRRLTRLTPVRIVRVYGSRARGDASPNSDLDIYIELDILTPGLRERISEVAWEVGFEVDTLISTLVVTREQLENGPMGAHPLMKQVMADGIPI